MRKVAVHADVYVGLPAIDLYIPVISMASMSSVTDPDATFLINISPLACLGAVSDLGLLDDRVALLVQDRGWTKWNISSFWQPGLFDLFQDFRVKRWFVVDPRL